MISISKNELKTLSNEYNVRPRECLLLLEDIISISYSKLFFQEKFELTQENFDKWKGYLRRRELKEPIAKILEKKEFYGITYKTNAHTLDPRPETELIIDLFQRYYPDKDAKLHILDLGCGTGCIGLTILSLYQNITCDFVDIAEQTLDVARENAQRLNLLQRSKFIQSNWFANIDCKYDVVLSNPPYISKNYKLEEDVLYDPHIALFAESEGFADIEFIVANSKDYLQPNGMLFVEIGFDQGDKIKSINTTLQLVDVYKDLSNIDRIAVFAVK